MNITEVYPEIFGIIMSYLSDNDERCLFCTCTHINDNKEQILFVKNTRLIQEKVANGSFTEFFYDSCSSNNYRLVELAVKTQNLTPKIIAEGCICAAIVESKKIFKFLLKDERIDKKAINNQLFQKLVEFGHRSSVKILLKLSQINPAANTHFALRRAVLNADLEMIKLLISDSRVDPIANNNYAVEHAFYNWKIGNRYEAIVELLLADPRVVQAVRSSEETRSNFQLKRYVAWQGFSVICLPN